MPEIPFADRLAEAVARKRSCACVGLDPVFERLPEPVRAAGADAPSGRLAAIRRFCLGVLEAVEPHVAAVKPQSAYFELYGAAGVALYEELVAAARRMGLLVVGDVKRGDIASTAAAYAAGHLQRPDSPDAITINAGFGSDGIEPFLEAAGQSGRGVFALVRTSNPSAAEVQDFADPDGRCYYEHLAALVDRLGSRPGRVGESGYSCLGAVVGATWPQQARTLREMMPRQIFLVPGYGAQGATAEDCRAAFDDDGGGAIVNASRSVLYPPETSRGADWAAGIEAAARAFAEDLRTAIL
jgi:orotidine-5'-phosphate decarboxylase